MSEAGDLVKSALERQQKAQQSARETAEEIDAQRERERAEGVAAPGLPLPTTPSVSP